MNNLAGSESGLEQGERRNRWGRRAFTSVPFIWLLAFFLIPFFFVLKISFADAIIASPPYTAVLVFIDDTLTLALSVFSYKFIFEDRLFLLAYLSSVKVAAISTLICLLIGYPIAYGIARTRGLTQTILLMLIIMPFWTSFLIRVYAWKVLLQGSGLLNAGLMALGIIDEPLRILYTDTAVYIGIVYSYMPFMILPLYAALAKLDYSLIEAACDLGCRPWQAFVKITLPLSIPGIIAGSMLVFIPAVGEFVIPEMLGGPDSLMIGRVLWNEFFANRDWPMASSVAIIILLLLVAPLMLFQRAQGRAGEP